MLCELNKVMDSDQLGSKVIENAVLEAFLVHARVVIDFLYTDPRKDKDDVVAQLFMPNGVDWKHERHPMSPLLLSAREGAHKLLAHLTFYRITADASWNVSEIYEGLRAAFLRFKELARSETLDPCWRGMQI